jgi:hypothetical protein
VKRAQIYANLLGGDICIIDKRRKSGSETKAVTGWKVSCSTIGAW